MPPPTVYDAQRRSKPNLALARLPNRKMGSVETTILIANLHCSSCVRLIQESLSALSPPPTAISTSIVSQSVVVEHSQELSPDVIKAALDDAGFDLVSTPTIDHYEARSLKTRTSSAWLTRKREKHAENCAQCQQERHEKHDQGGKTPVGTVGRVFSGKISDETQLPPTFTPISAFPEAATASQTPNDAQFHATFSIDGMTCASCSGTITKMVSEITGVHDVAVSLIGKSATMTLSHRDLVQTVLDTIDDCGFGGELISLEVYGPSPRVQQSKKVSAAHGAFKVTCSIDGMTCASCSGTITRMVSELQGVSDVAVSLVGKSATMTIQRQELVDNIKETIEDAGYGCEVISVDEVQADHDIEESGESRIEPRTIALRVEGMFCRHCPEKLMKALEPFSSQVEILQPLASFDDPKAVLRLSYTPSPPSFTIRSIIASLEAAKSPPFKVSIARPPSLEERARAMHARELHRLLRRLLASVIIAIPTFIIAIVYMSLVPSENQTRQFFMSPIWTGNTSRAQWALFFLATPAMFYSAGLYHRRTLKELKGLWRKGSKTPIWRRFVRFGSMNMLVSMGVSIAYFSSIALLGLAAAQQPMGHGMGDTTTYFDSVVFLTMFLLAGRCLEAHSKDRTADAVNALGKLRPATALLLTTESKSIPSASSSQDGLSTAEVDLEKGDAAAEKVEEKADLALPTGTQLKKINVEFLEVGDIVRVPHGSTPPSDGTIVTGDGGAFDESSLTGESKLVKKQMGDRVFVGTINKGRAVDMRVTSIGGETMLDQIVKIVRDGQTKRAPIERLADMLTGYFVPVITLLAILTWVIWLSLGLSGSIPQSYLDIPIGGWAVWSLEFAIAVFVVACPCGIGLAAPTALLVGSGLAAKYGILVRGGGEAFQEAAQLDIIVFDKTGTLTQGGEPRVTDYDMEVTATTDTEKPRWTPEQVLGLAAELENASSHPIATAIRNFCAEKGAVDVTASDSVKETGGRGLEGMFVNPRCTAIIGNEAWMAEHKATLTAKQEHMLQQWKTEGKSVVLLACREEDGRDDFDVLAMFGIADQLRPEARTVIHALQKQGLGTWMISGDNETTAKAVAKMVGIPETNVIAGVLPHQKAEKVAWLQQVGAKREQGRLRRMVGLKDLNERCIVAMVGDGINDAPALTTADVGLAIGSGSDVAMSSASFNLVQSDLRSILTLTDLSRTVFNRIKFNFLWAVIYNLIALPIAAGVIYPVHHARLDPVWASLAMALSSVTVVASSLMMKGYREPKAAKRDVTAD